MHIYGTQKISIALKSQKIKTDCIMIKYYNLTNFDKIEIKFINQQSSLSPEPQFQLFFILFWMSSIKYKS